LLDRHVAPAVPETPAPFTTVAVMVRFEPVPAEKVSTFWEREVG